MCPTPTTLYLLVSNDHTQFKIGISKNFGNRVQGLGGYHNFDLEISREIIWPTKKDALNAERALHFFFESHKVDSDHNVAGFTEWFDYKCFNEVLSFINIIMDKRGLPQSSHRRSVIPSAVKNNDSLRPFETNKHIIKKNKQAKYNSISIQNTSFVKLSIDILTAIKPYCKKVILINNHKILVYNIFGLVSNDDSILDAILKYLNICCCLHFMGGSFNLINHITQVDNTLIINIDRVSLRFALKYPECSSVNIFIDYLTKYKPYKPCLALDNNLKQSLLIFMTIYKLNPKYRSHNILKITKPSIKYSPMPPSLFNLLHIV